MADGKIVQLSEVLRVLLISSAVTKTALEARRITFATQCLPQIIPKEFLIESKYLQLRVHLAFALVFATQLAI